MDIDAIENDIKVKTNKAASIAANKFYDLMTNILDRYYGEYTSIKGYYDRTGQLRSSAKIIGVNGTTITLGYTDENFSHILGDWSENDVLANAMIFGTHGGANPGGTKVFPATVAAIGEKHVGIIVDALVASGL